MMSYVIRASLCFVIFTVAIVISPYWAVAGDESRPPHALAVNIDAPSTHPALYCEPDTVDLGIVGSNQSLTAKWQVMNQLAHDVRVTKIRPGCGCTKAELRNLDGVVKAGSSTDVVATVSTKNVRGAKKIKIILETDAPECPMLEVNVELSVNPPIKLDAKMIDFGEVNAVVGSVKTINVQSNTEVEFHIDAVKAVEADRIKVDVKEVRKGKEYELSVTILAGAKVGTMRTIVQLVTDNPGIDVVEIPVYAKIVNRSMARVCGHILSNRSCERAYILVGSDT